jgi:hypothetical protein
MTSLNAVLIRWVQANIMIFQIVSANQLKNNLLQNLSAKTATMKVRSKMKLVVSLMMIVSKRILKSHTLRLVVPSKISKSDSTN